MVEMEVTLDDIADDLKFRVSWEWHLAWEHDVEHYTHWPDIDLRVVVLQEYLRCDVIWLEQKGRHTDSLDTDLTEIKNEEYLQSHS